jgi:pyrroloquinoline quinone (PQQ) biosynthesis protein C
MTVGTNAALQLEPDTSILGYLQGGIRDLLDEIQGATFWHTVTSAQTEPALVKEIMKQVYLEIHWYQPDVIEATMAVIGQFPRSMPAKRVRTMLVHQADEWDHGEMALKDYVGLGGSEAAARSSPMSPTAFITAAFWRMLAHKREPFAYLGALYLFEGLTPLVTGLVKGNLEAKGLREDALGYIEFHSTEDIKHARVVDHLISEVIRAYPESADSIRFGFDTFRSVYPLPGWWAAYQRGLAEYERATG